MCTVSNPATYSFEEDNYSEEMLNLNQNLGRNNKKIWAKFIVSTVSSTSTIWLYPSLWLIITVSQILPIVVKVVLIWMDAPITLIFP